MRLTSRKESADKQERIALVERLLATPMSVDDVQAEMKMARSNVSGYVKTLYSKRKVHICAWRFNQRHYPVYMAGEGEDVPKPVREAEVEEEIFKRPPTVVRVHRDPLIAALFGDAA